MYNCGHKTYYINRKKQNMFRKFLNKLFRKITIIINFETEIRKLHPSKDETFPVKLTKEQLELVLMCYQLNIFSGTQLYNMLLKLTVAAEQNNKKADFRTGLQN